MGVYRGGKDTTASYRALDIRWLHHKGMLNSSFPNTITWTRAGEVTAGIRVFNRNGYVILEYSHTRNCGERKDYSYPIEINWTDCNYGGRRPWFICPASACGRRVAVLYGGSLFACRVCHNIVYESQHEAPHYRALRRFHKVIEKLGGEPSDGIPSKPKGMHWRTYNRLHHQAQCADSLSCPPWLLRHFVNQ
jgi:hypothetical protein